MHLYHLTLQKPGAITKAIFGNFSGKFAQEFVAIRGHTLDLLRPDEAGQLHCVSSTPVFGVIRDVIPFRVTGASVDHVVVASDSGRITVLKFNAEASSFEKVHQETYGKTGCRRVTPGQFLAADPNGRALMTGALEKQKLVYVMNRDASERLTISSPLEAHKSKNLLFDVVGVDVGFENPVFACLELDYADVDLDPSGEALEESEKFLTFYELDLGLNHVVRKWSEATDRLANKLVAVPAAGGGGFPGGVLVFAENFVIYQNRGHREVRTPIPRRVDTPESRGVLLVAAATHRQKDFFFVLAQSEYGDLYKISLECDGDEVVDLKVKYFDTLPPCRSICISKTGFLFCASEFGDHGLYRFVGIGDDDTVEAGAISAEDIEADSVPFLYFSPRTLQNLELLYEMESLAPILDLQVNATAAEATQLYAFCGRGPRSSLRLLRHGLKVTEYAQSPLPGVPTAVWTIRENVEDAAHRFIIVSFEDATLVLRVGESVEEVQDSQFVTNTKTFWVGQLADGSVVQVHPGGYRRIARGLADKTDWACPTGANVTHGQGNERQVVLVLSTGELAYFELSEGSGGELEETNHKMGANVRISCVDIGDVPEGQLRAPYLALGYESRKVELLSLSPGPNRFSKLGIQSFEHKPSSVTLSLSKTEGGVPRTFLTIGVHRGYLIRIEVTSTGQLNGDTARVRHIGTRPVKLVKVDVGGQSAVLALSSRSWLLYNFQSQFFMTPLSFPALDFAANFRSDEIVEGMVAISGGNLLILAIDQLGDVFNQQQVTLSHTPRRGVIDSVTGNLVVIETDHNAFTSKEKQQIKDADAAAAASEGGGAAKAEDEEEEVDEAQVGAQMPDQPGKWASCIRVLDLSQEEEEAMTTAKLDLEDNEAAFSVCIAELVRSTGGHAVKCLVVGTAKDLQLHPRSVKCGYIHVYMIVYEGGGEGGYGARVSLKLQHKTKVEDVPYALCGFHGQLLASCGHSLRLYSLGKQTLLKKCQNNNFPFFIATLHTMNRRIYVGDLQDSVVFCKHRKETNELVIFADEVVPRHITCGVPLDYDTFFGADKFGNIFADRLPEDTNEDVVNPTGNRILWDSGRMNGAPNKLTNIMSFHVGETVTTCAKTKLYQAGAECVVLGSVMGSVTAAMPFASRDNVDFFSQLEMYMRNEHNSLVGRDQLSYRSYFMPVKCVVDGDLCETFTRLPAARQKHIAAELDRTPGEIVKKLEEIRSRIL